MQIKTTLPLLAVVLTLLVLPFQSFAQVKGSGPYVSEMRDQCIAEMSKDAQIQVACKTQYSNEYHDQDAARATTNNKHVVMAYGALWIIVTIFVVGMWLKQRKLSEEIASLEEELAKAAAE